MRSLFVWPAVLLSLALALAGSALADTNDELAPIEALYAKANWDNEAALRELAVFRAGLPPSTSYRVRLAAVKAEIIMLFFAGRAREADAALAHLRQLAEQQADHGAIALSMIWTAGQLLESGRAEAALAKLREAEPVAKRSADPDALQRLASSFGEAYTALGSFELALQHHLEAMRLTEATPESQPQKRLSELNSTSVLYMSMRNPEQALATALQGQAIVQANAKEVANAAMTANLINQGFALSELGRGADSLSAFERALTLARAAKLPAAEASALLNISDYHLRLHAYTRAAEYARQAISLAERSGKKMSLGIATANLGFAVAGQGRIREGAAQVLSAIRMMHDAGAIVDEAGLLGELGQMYVRAGWYREAVETVLAQQKLDRDIFKSDRARAVASLQERFDATQRQRQIERLEGQNQLKDAELRNQHLVQTTTLLGMLLTLLSAVFFIALYRRARQANQALAHVNRQLEFHAVHDPLTGLHNRRSFLRRMEQRSTAGQGLRSGDAPSSADGLVILDIDHFKKINDNWGHIVGDQVLIEVANRIRDTVRESDMALRWGGEEFLVYPPKCESAANLAGLASRLLRVIGELPMQIGAQRIAVTMSAGFVCLPFADVPESECDWQKTLQLADMALYHAKHQGRNRAVGLLGLREPWQQARPLLDCSLNQALPTQVLDWVELPGPTPSVGPAGD